jgi:hypothetical protein
MNDAYDVEIMVRELTEYELNFLDFPTVIKMVREQIRKRYDDMSYQELVRAYEGVFNWPETENMKDVL